MSEEANVKPEEKKEEPKKEESPQSQALAPQKKAEPQVKRPEIVPKPTNCMKCNKRLQRKTCYYRNGGYYCSKRCWKLAEAEKKAKAAKK